MNEHIAGVPISAPESWYFNYWLMVMQLLKIGIPYDVILRLEEEEVNTILGIQMALNERQEQAIRQEKW